MIKRHYDYVGIKVMLLLISTDVIIHIIGMLGVCFYTQEQRKLMAGYNDELKMIRCL